MVARYESEGEVYPPELSCLVSVCNKTELRTPLGVRLGLGEQPFSKDKNIASHILGRAQVSPLGKVGLLRK